MFAVNIFIRSDLQNHQVVNNSFPFFFKFPPFLPLWLPLSLPLFLPPCLPIILPSFLARFLSEKQRKINQPQMLIYDGKLSQLLATSQEPVLRTLIICGR